MSTTPPPQPPENPYGPPPTPGPYGQQPPPPPYQAPQPGPYGQQQPPPPSPYGQQQPYGAPAPAPWGAPVLPPRKSRLGLILGIVGGVVVLAVAGVAGLYWIGAKSDTGFPDAEYKLTLPQKVLDDKYELASDLSGAEGKTIEDEADGAWDARDTKAVVGQYSLGGDQAQGTLVISGMYGRFKNTGLARDNMMEGAAGGKGAKVAVKPKDFKPAGSDVTVTCEVLVQTQLGTEITIPVCGWVDGNTGASVAEITADTVTKKPAQVDLAAAAETAVKIREEIRKPIG
ncbi:hypothetical protein ACKI1I_22375 [Streptomyces turgidiscabies]|uniref:Uncharacterized protein n=1 Tax=Streptomyces turgidiscabies (strain Car8) TaxID=698760 RepID=L7F301_STRT8|nr:hypothetical protein [Streptomyces turgidiscabies]ELP65386.1 hypothetical protein STRTUCAR8_07436 [Streptomyces turgidiscabies Car8]MDX3495526.1 hypothetical protein [Streptomyces turgidiscabies]GAQ70214.1 hypothetical protein T45_01948 [Streptomyces turgidiscabies]